ALRLLVSSFGSESALTNAFIRGPKQEQNPDIVSGFLLADLRRWLVRYAEAKIDFGKLSSFYKIVKQVCVALRTNALDQLYKSVQDLDEEWLQLK
ncbi:hypothetical protein TIFTF001_043211, partial [Ficus carica]